MSRSDETMQANARDWAVLADGGRWSLRDGIFEITCERIDGSQ
jgi:hypothetical protein